MRPILTLSIAALLLLQATGLDVVVASQTCSTTCPTDEADGACGPLCSDCFCCPTLRSCVQPDSGLSLPLVSTLAPEAERTPLPPKADPADIFHVPKTALT